MSFVGLISLLLLSANPELAKASEPTFPEDGQPSPTSGTSAGSRGDCDFDATPLLPAGQQAGLTTQTTPTLWVQIPADAEIASLRLDVRTSTGDRHTARLRNLDPSPAGVVHIALPEAVALPVTEFDSTDPSDWTQWTVSMYCGTDGDLPALVQGSIQRVAIEGLSDADLAGQSPQAISNRYAQNGVWYDALTALGEARLAAPEDLELLEAWRTLLNYSTVGLEAIADEPLADCCTLTD